MSGLPVSETQHWLPKRKTIPDALFRICMGVGASREPSWPLLIVPVLFDRSGLNNLRDSFARAADHNFVQARGH